MAKAPNVRTKQEVKSTTMPSGEEMSPAATEMGKPPLQTHLSNKSSHFSVQ